MDPQNQPPDQLSPNEPSINAERVIAKLWIALKSEQDLPLHRQLFNQLKDLIASLQLMPGELLPSTRELANSLGMSRKTVTRAYDDLTSQGFIQSKAGIGTFVSRVPATIADVVPKEVTRDASSYKLSRYGESIRNTTSREPSHQGELPELHFGALPPEQLPLDSWRKVILKILRENDFAVIDYDTDPFGYYPLRSSIASYLLRSRGLRCKPEQVIVFANALSHLRLFSRIFIEAGDTVAMENPGFPFARRLFTSLSAQLAPIEIDDEGIKVVELEAQDEAAKLVYVTPSHQDPTGTTMSASRRHDLLTWASDNHCLIVEDDYDCEFRYTGERIPSLAAMDKSDTVVYLGDFWKTLFPVVNVGYLVLPPGLVDAFRKAQSLSWTKEDTSLPLLEKLALTEFIENGHYENHIKKTRETFASRYRNMVHTMTRCFGTTVQLAKDSGGMQVLLRVNLPVRDADIVRTAAQAGLAIIPTQPYYFERRVEKEFLLSFVKHEESVMTACIEKWAKLLA